MKIKTAAVTYARKFNLGNYEAAEISASLWSEVEEGDDEEGVLAYLFDICKEQVRENVPPSYKRAVPNYSETFTKFGQPVTPDQTIAFDGEK